MASAAQSVLTCFLTSSWSLFVKTDACTVTLTRTIRFLITNLPLRVDGGVGLLSHTENGSRPYTGKTLVKTNSRLSSSVSKSKTLTLWQKDFVPKKSTKLNKEETEKLSFAIDETKTFLNISQFYYEVVPTNKTLLQWRQCGRERPSRGHRILPQDFSILHLASQGCYSVHSNRLQRH